MKFFDILLGGFRSYRRLRGGRWEAIGMCCALPTIVWRRVDVPRWNIYPPVRFREDHRR